VSWQSGRDRAVQTNRAPADRAAAAADLGAPAGTAGPLLAIAEACRATGLSARTLRYYEELGLLPGVRRRAGGRRVYGADEVERLRFIQRLKALGLSLAEVKQLNAVYAIAGSTQAMLGRLDELLGRRLADLDARIAELEGLREEIESYRERIRRRSRAGAPPGARAPEGGGERPGAAPTRSATARASGGGER
jgi:DNA-binding transcriptional MerR regulator